MLKGLIRYFAKKTHNVRIQLLCATLFGLLELYGFGGTIAIIMKARKLADKPCNRVTVKYHKVKP
jgi:hypothetical protein